MKRLFSCADNTFCKLESCEKKDRCRRYLKHYPQYKNHPRLSFYMIDDENKCTLFSPLYIDKLDEINTSIK